MYEPTLCLLVLQFLPSGNWWLILRKGQLVSVILGAFGAGLAFSTKGQIALLVIGVPILCYLGYTKQWLRLFNWKVLIALLFFGLTIAPMLYAYYLQFDLHPEKVIRGKNNRSGIFFIFWEQSFERLSGNGMGKNSSDYSFFFHTFLWVFLPWTVMGILAYISSFKMAIKLKGKINPRYELLTLGGISLIFVIISFAQFKLPHYLNITIPLFSVLTAAYLHTIFLDDKTKTLKVLLKIQYFILGLVYIAAFLCCFYVFKVESIWVWLMIAILFVISVFYLFKKEAAFYKIITISVCAAVLLNMVLNAHFYPSLLKYQAGSSMAEEIANTNIPVDKVYKLTKAHTWGLDFYNKMPVKRIAFEDIKGQKELWLYVDDQELEALKKGHINFDNQITVDQFRITRLQAKFLNPNTRESKLNKRHLVQVLN